MRHVPPKIIDVGLENYLDSTRAKHFDKGYSEFVQMVEASKVIGEPVPKSGLARAFNVSWITVDKWLKIYEDEHAS